MRECFGDPVEGRMAYLELVNVALPGLLLDDGKLERPIHALLAPGATVGLGRGELRSSLSSRLRASGDASGKSRDDGSGILHLDKRKYDNLQSK